eukprot:Pgem_evm1s8151
MRPYRYIKGKAEEVSRALSARSATLSTVFREINGFVFLISFLLKMKYLLTGNNTDDNVNDNDNNNTLTLSCSDIDGEGDDDDNNNDDDNDDDGNRNGDDVEDIDKDTAVHGIYYPYY